MDGYAADDSGYGDGNVEEDSVDNKRRSWRATKELALPRPIAPTSSSCWSFGFTFTFSPSNSSQAQLCLLTRMSYLVVYVTHKECAGYHIYKTGQSDNWNPWKLWIKQEKGWSFVEENVKIRGFFQWTQGRYYLHQTPRNTTEHAILLLTPCTILIGAIAPGVYWGQKEITGTSLSVDGGTVYICWFQI